MILVTRLESYVRYVSLHIHEPALFIYSDHNKHVLLMVPFVNDGQNSLCLTPFNFPILVDSICSPSLIGFWQRMHVYSESVIIARFLQSKQTQTLGLTFDFVVKSSLEIGPLCARQIPPYLANIVGWSHEFTSAFLFEQYTLVTFSSSLSRQYPSITKKPVQQSLPLALIQM